MIPGGPVMMGSQLPMMGAGSGLGPSPSFFGIHPEPATYISPTPGEAQAEEAEFAYTHSSNMMFGRAKSSCNTLMYVFALVDWYSRVSFWLCGPHGYF